MNPSELTKLTPHELSRLLKSLSYREREILKLIAGVGDGFRYTPDEVAHIFKVNSSEIEITVKAAMLKVESCLSLRTLKDDSPIPEASGIIITVAIPEFCDGQDVADKIVELYCALNGMHISLGGNGLVVNDDQTFSGVAVLAGAPVE